MISLEETNFRDDDNKNAKKFCDLVINDYFCELK